MQYRQPDDPNLIRVRGDSLSEALRNVRREHGAEARIVGSRTVYRSEGEGLGRRREIEVLVAAGDGSAEAVPAAGEVTAALAAEVARLEAMARDLERRHDESEATEADPIVAAYPLAGPLRATGAGEQTVARLARLYAAESAGREPTHHLRSLLRASGGSWEDIAGSHLFLGQTGVGKTELVLGAAARLRDAGRRVLVLLLMPRHDGDVRRLQHEAATHGYDAAVIRESGQLERSRAYFDGYDAVLIDTPALDATPMRDDPELRAQLAGLEAMHRHLVVAMDVEEPVLAAAATARRDWECDWVALTRLDRTRRPGRLADLLAAVAVPVSLAAGGRWPEAAPSLPTAEDLLKHVLAVGLAPASAVARAS